MINVFDTTTPIIRMLDSSENRTPDEEQEKIYFKKLCDYIAIHIMEYPEGTPLPEPLKNCVRNTVATLKLQTITFCCADLITVFEICDSKIRYCFKNMNFANDKHKVNTALKIARENYINALIVRQKQENAVKNNETFFIDRCDDRNLMETRLKKACNDNDEVCDKIIASLILAYLGGYIGIKGIAEWLNNQTKKD